MAMQKEKIWELLNEVLARHDSACLDDPYENYFLLMDLFGSLLTLSGDR